MCRQDDALAQRKVFKERDGSVHRRAIVQYFLNVILAFGGGRTFPGHELEHLAHGGAGALDPRGEDRFLGRQRR